MLSHSGWNSIKPFTRVFLIKDTKGKYWTFPQEISEFSFKSKPVRMLQCHNFYNQHKPFLKSRSDSYRPLTGGQWLRLLTVYMYCILLASRGVRMFLRGQRQWKLRCADHLYTNVLSPGPWLMWGSAEEQFQQCYQEQTEGAKGPNPTGVPSVDPHAARVWFTQWMDGVWCGLRFCLPRVCIYAHVGWRELCFCVYTLSEDLPFTTPYCWLVWPCGNNSFVPSAKNFHRTALDT